MEQAAKRAHPRRSKRLKFKRNHNEEQINASMEQLPKRVSRFCRRSSIRFPQLVPVALYDDYGEATLVRTFPVVTFLCHDTIKVKSFGNLNFWSDIDANVILYDGGVQHILLSEIKLHFKMVGDFMKTGNYDKTIATAAGIPEDAVYKENNWVQDVQRQIAQILSERARYIKKLTMYAPFHNFHVDLPRAISSSLEILHLSLGTDEWAPPGVIHCF
eukprot:scaffold249_cov262-Chaetoceros_neogracile.AAC.3